ncbi:DUF932 domain-containing protein [Halomonas sp. 3A7M]|uniref:DUF932 domain-containing protein n=1 Tax=Halomonas sp. 3A7M TaxID=2742616 RepID=UPI001869580F|nr:DUF932 domain-containing protein [Halomonas sp. 3A7M]
MGLVSSLGNIKQIRRNEPLSDDMIHRAAPSIFAEAPHESRSERYHYIPTIDVVNALRNEGFYPFFAAQTNVRKADKREHTKHMLRLRHASQINAQEANEIILVNSHDGSSSYQMLAGMFRFVCANGMVCGNTVGDVRVRHSGKGDIIGEVIEGAYTVRDAFEVIENERDTMRGIQLTPQLQHGLAQAVLNYKHDDPLRPAPIEAEQLLRARRHEDRPNDLWSTTNRIQENVIKGGLSGRNAKGKRTTTRAVKGIDQDLKLNKALWAFSMEMSKLFN